MRSTLSFTVQFPEPPATVPRSIPNTTARLPPQAVPIAPSRSTPSSLCNAVSEHHRVSSSPLSLVPAVFAGTATSVACVPTACLSTRALVAAPAAAHLAPTVTAPPRPTPGRPPLIPVSAATAPPPSAPQQPQVPSKVTTAVAFFAYAYPFTLSDLERDLREAENSARGIVSRSVAYPGATSSHAQTLIGTKAASPGVQGNQASSHNGGRSPETLRHNVPATGPSHGGGASSISGVGAASGGAGSNGPTAEPFLFESQKSVSVKLASCSIIICYALRVPFVCQPL